MNPPTTIQPGLAIVFDSGDDAAFTHSALAAHHPPAGRVTLHPGPGTTSDTALAHDLLLALGKPAHIPGRFPHGRPPLWEAAAAWTTALAVTRLTVLRAHLLDERRLQRVLTLWRQTGIHLTLVVHRPRLTAALDRALADVSFTRTTTLAAARALYGKEPRPQTDAGPPPEDAARPGKEPGRWLTLSSLDRLVSYDSPSPCTGPCTPGPIDWKHRPAPIPLTPSQAEQATRRIHAVTAHPQLAAALASTLFTGASFQQLATARSDDFHDKPALLALHDQARFTDGCATHAVPPWAQVFLRAAARYAHLTQAAHLLAGPGQRPAVLRLAEAARLRPPQPPDAGRAGRKGTVVWDWREVQEAHGYYAPPTIR
ncbi:hypothetical protein OHS33_37190 [Streptomyces sp. NBC_00536]|uniref:hypothetical protein n=1 Tax=Streptomyces sp. NBC_00536 TaxID=2975769 RepID=UPI002E7FD662|nr:hypothetical protein [Streptomyces sp. NBC_00536]WUC83501.1 hypothetical protein OHS33_37190 [Streptomyces sp. NBC_00536]